MTSKVRNLSYLVDKQLPAFINTEYPKFSAFLQKYYEHLELPGNPLHIINNLEKYRDIDSYNNESLSETTVFLSLSESNNQINITVEDASAFPYVNGYILIENEAIFYKEREGNTFVDCYRNVNATTKLGDLYEESTNTEIPYENVGNSDSQFSVGSVVRNISNLFLFALVKNFEKEYLGSFPESSLKPEVNKNILIKNIKQFYKVKGTEKSIQFIFNSIVSRNPEDVPTVYYPKDYTFKSSNGTWITKYGLKVKLLSGDINRVLGSKLVQKKSLSDEIQAFGIIDNIIDIGEDFYEVVLSTSTIVGEFQVASQTYLTDEVLSSESDIINVYSTLGWDNIGKLYINDEEVFFEDKTVNQFKSLSRTSPIYHASGSLVYNEVLVRADYEDINGESQLLTAVPLGVIYNLSVAQNTAYLSENDRIQVTSSGSVISDVQIIDKNTGAIRWRINEVLDTPSSSNAAIVEDLSRVISEVSAVFEDSQYFYITSSGYPSHSIGKSFWNVTLNDQKHLKLIKRNPTVSTNITKIESNEVGVLVNGVTIRSHKDEEKIVFGEIQEVTITNQGRGYLDPPYVLVEDSTGVGVASVKAILSGEVVERVEVIEGGAGFFPPVPTVTITSGRNATVTPIITSGKITSIKIDNPGEYYSTPPKVLISDASGKGRFAEYISEISDDGKLVGFKKISEGKDYNPEETTITIQSVGEGATAVSEVRTWTRNRYAKLQNSLDDHNGYYFLNNKEGVGYGYSYVANPKGLRVQIGDNLDSNYITPSVLNHSPIIGFAYDGYPIYGPYGYVNALDKNSSISRMTSSYSLKSSRPLGPSILTYPLGYFIEDYQYTHRSGTLDENNGRYCVTPEYPNGTYAYFITIDSNQSPIYPYLLGENFYGTPVDSNYKKITQTDIPRNIKRIHTQNTPENGEAISAVVDQINTGSVNAIEVVDSNNIFSNGNIVEIDYGNQEYTRDVKASVSEVDGKSVVSLQSKETKAVQILSKNTAYLFANSILYQENTGAFGTILGNVVNDSSIVLKNVVGTFNDVDKLYSDIVVASLLLDKSSSFTLGSTVVLSNGKQAGVEKVENNRIFLAINPFTDGERVVFTKSFNGVQQDTPYFIVDAQATSFKISLTLNGTTVNVSNVTSPGSLILSEQAKGEVLQTVQEGNTLIVKVIRGEFIVDDDYIIRSSNVFDTSNSKIAVIRYLHDNIEISELRNNIAIATTTEDHLLTEGDEVTIDINPDDSQKTTTYFVRRRIYQKVKLPSLNITKQIFDSGVGSLKALNGGGYYVFDGQGNVSNVEGDYANGGNATYNNVELIFADQNLCRSLNGSVIIGNPNNQNNARATVNITNGVVTSFTITSKGKYYKKGDILTVAASSLGRPVISSNTRSFLAEVDHVGFHSSNTRLFLDNLESLAVNDILKINDELVKITSLNANDEYVTVQRGVEGSEIQNHFDLSAVIVYNSGFTLSKGYRVGFQSGSPYVNEYDREEQTLEVYYDIDTPLSSINELMPEMTFFDQGSPAKIAVISDILEEPSYRFEFSLDNVIWLKNPLIDIQTYYKYKFNTDHYSMIGSYIEFSPSGNYNIIPNNVTRNSILPGYPGSFVTIKTGYGEQLQQNNTQNKKIVEYGNYFYFDKSGTTTSDGGYLKLVSDPLQGNKTITYVTSRSFVYNLDSIPAYDGSGSIRYTTTSKTAVGKIRSIKISDSGGGLSFIPTIKGVRPNQQYECVVDVNWSSVSKNIASLIINDSGLGYSKPIAIVTNGDGKFAAFKITKDANGSIVSINVENRGTGYTFKPEVKIIESDVESYCYSNTIGTAKSIKIVNNGKAYNNDISIQRSFSTPSFLVLKDFTGDFLEGEVVIQYDGQVEVARGIVYKNGWKTGSNILKIENIEGNFVEGLPILSSIKKSEATVSSIFKGLFTPIVKSYSDNIGYYSSDRSKLGSLSQRLADSYFYQDYSYVIESDTQINDWRNTIKETTHPAGFISFGEVNIRSTGNASFAPNATSLNTFRLLQLWDDDTSDRRVTIQSTTTKVTETISSIKNVNQFRGKGSIIPLQYDSSETLSYDFFLDPPFNGYFDSNGNREGTKTFTMKLRSSNTPLNVSNVNNLFVTLDGILQEPGKSFTVSGTQITFAEPPLGNRNVFGDPISPNQYIEGVDTKSQSCISRYIGFKDSSLNTTYFNKIKNISDQFDGIKNEFDLYYENDTPVELDANDNLFVSIDGVFQVPGITPLLPMRRSYYIRKTTTPNTIVFTEPPKREENIPQSFFAYRVGNYISLTIDSYLIAAKKTGPFILRSVLNRRNVFIDDDRNLLVFVDNVLQRRNKSYTINGSNITFSETLNVDAKIDIFYLYGRDFQKFITAFGFEDTPFFNRYDITVSQAQVDLNYGYGQYVNAVIDAVDEDSNIVASGRIAKISKQGSFNLGDAVYVITVESSINKKIEEGYNLIVRQIRGNYGDIDVYISDFKVLDVDEFRENDETFEIIDKQKPGWLQGTSLEPIYDDNLEVEDLIKIDGEEDFRTIRSLPREAYKTQYRQLDDVNTNYYGKLEVSSYNKPQRGEGLNIIANVDTDEDSATYRQIISLTWNKKDYNDYIQTTIFPQPNAYGYENLPELMFIPQPVKDEGGFITASAQGGGARAFAIIDNGEIIDLVLLSGGGEYLTSPKVYVTYGYDVVKSNKNLTTTYFNIGIDTQLVPGIKLSNTITVTIPTLKPNIYNTSIPFVSPSDTKHHGITIIQPEIESGNELGWNETRVDVIVNMAADISSFNDLYSIFRIHLETPLQDVQSISSLETSSLKNAFVVTGAVDSYGDENYSVDYAQNQLGASLGNYDFNGLQFASVGINDASAFTLEMVDLFFPSLTIEDFENRFESNYTESKDYWNVGRDSVTEYGAILQIPLSASLVYFIDDISGFAGQTITITQGGLFSIVISIANDLAITIVSVSPNAPVGTYVSIGGTRFGYQAPDTIVYIEDTSRFPSSGSLLIGDELITYSSKLSDRFMGVKRGVNGTPVRSHSAGDYLRTQGDPIDFGIPTYIDGNLYSLPSYYYSHQETFVDITSNTVLTRSGTFTLE
jgi:hypothetical protein